MAKRLDGLPLGMVVGLGPSHIVLDGDPALPKRGTAPLPNLAYVCCGQMAGWIKMRLGREVGLGQGDIVLDGDQTSPEKGAQQLPTFRPIYAWMDHDAIWCGHAGHIVLDGDAAPPPCGDPVVLLGIWRSCLLIARLREESA